MGESVTSSREDAISQLVLYFNSKITIDSTSSLSIRESGNFLDKERDVSSKISIFSEAELPAISFTESYFHEKSGKWYVCAYIDKSEATKITQAKVQKDIKNIQAFSRKIQRSSQVSEFVSLSKTLKDIENLQKTVGVLSVLDFESADGVQSKIDALENDCKEKIQTLKEQMRFSINIENDFDDGITTALKEILENEGFVYELQGKLCLKGVFKTSMTENSAGVFVTPRLSLQIIDLKNGGASLASYTKAYQKWGHINEEGAMKKAVFEVEKDLKEHFMEIFR